MHVRKKKIPARFREFFFFFVFFIFIILPTQGRFQPITSPLTNKCVLTKLSDQTIFMLIGSNMSVITQRSIFLLNDKTVLAKFLKELKQDEKDIVIPGSAEFEMQRQEKITIPYENMNPQISDLFAKVGMLEMRFSPKVSNSQSVMDEQWKHVLFSDFTAENTFGLDIEVAPQSATSFHEYKNTSFKAIKSLEHILKVRSKDIPIFYQEWFQKRNFDLDEKSSLELIVLRLWNAILARNTEFPVRLPDIGCASSVDFVLHNEKHEASITLYWDSVKRPVIISKKYVIQEADSISSEIAIFMSKKQAMSTYDPPLTGLRMKLNNETYNAQNRIIKFLPTMLHASQTHRTLHGYHIKHEILKPVGMHPDYKMSIVEDDKRSAFAPPRSSADTQCSLMLQLSVPKQIIIDKYELERLKGKLFKDFRVHNNGMNLELPEYRVKEWGGALSAVLDADYIMNRQNESFVIPLHLRYGKPLGDFQETYIPKAQVYWECSVTEDKQKEVLAKSFYNEPDRLGIDKFVKHSVFYHVRDSDRLSSNSIKVEIPTANLKDAYSNELWTSVLVALGTIYILISLVKPLS